MVPRRVAEREAARVEAAALAPWRAGIARARLIKRLLVAQEQAALRAERGVGSDLGQEARIEKSRQDPMNPGAVRADGGDGGLGSGLGQEARIEKSRQDPMNPGAVSASGGNGGLGSGLGQEARGDETPTRCHEPWCGRRGRR
jgi:hypothetical protein